jgi:hypothetical protein
VAKTLAASFLKHGPNVVMGTRDLANLAGPTAWAQARCFSETAKQIVCGIRDQ